MKSPLLIFLFIFAAYPVFTQNTPLYSEIFFKVQEAKITEQHKIVLDEIINNLNNYVDFKIIISGHADGMGEQSSNEKLSKRRAKAVQYYFMENRILAEKTEILAYGEARPALSNNNASGRKHNRRVDITVYYQLHKTASPSEIKKIPINELYKDFTPPRQIFCINPQRDTCLRARGGTLIYVKANSFDLTNIFLNPTCINLGIKEVFKNAEMVIENLSTTSNGQIMQPQGMILVTAYIDDTPLTLARGKDVLLFVPQKDLELTTKPYDGHRFDSDNTINWTTNNTSITGNFSLSTLNQCVIAMQDERAQQNNRFSLLSKSRYSEEELKKDYLVTSSLSPNCQNIGKLFYRYQISNLKMLSDIINQPLYELFAVDKLKDLNQAILVEQNKAESIEKQIAEGESPILSALLLKNITLDFQNEKVDYEQLKYYSYNITRMGWSTLNSIPDFTQIVRRNLIVNLPPEQHLDIKLVSKKSKFVLGAQSKKSHYFFENVPTDYPLFIVAFKYENKIPYLAIQPVTEMTDTYEIDFKPISLDQITNKLDFLN